MTKLLESNVKSVSEADIIIIGFPDESRSDAVRKGTKKALEFVRRAYNDKEYFGDVGKKVPILPMSGSMKKNIYDLGNSRRSNIKKLASYAYCSRKIPIIIGGDHSLTSIVLR